MTRVEGALHVDARSSEAAQINRAATVAGVTLRELRARRDSLEAVFLAMTGSDDGELAADRGAAAQGSRPAAGATR